MKKILAFALAACTMFLSVVAADGFREVVSADSFTMLNIIPSSPGREEMAAADAKEFAERTGNPYCLYCLTLHPQGKPAMKTVEAAVASYRKWAKLLEETSVKPAILLQSIIGHWTNDLAEKDTEPWQRAVNWKGVVTRYCPLDPGYQAYIRETARKLAECRPVLILGDDDIRAFSPLAECTCPLHVAEYNRRTGKKLSPDGLRALLAKADRKSAEHMAFAELQRDTVNIVYRLLREGIDSVDPGIPSGVCEPGAAWSRRYIADFARMMAGPNHTAWTRLANGQYYESSPKETMGELVLRTMAGVERLKGTGLLLLDEADTWPHNLWSKSSVSFHAKLSASVFVGLKGAKLWFVNTHRGCYPVSRHYTDILAHHRGFYPSLSAAVNGTMPTGILIPCRKDYPTFGVTGSGSRDTFDQQGWAQKIFSWYGIPFRATEDFAMDGIYALGGTNSVKGRTDEDIRKMLSKKVLIDGLAARELVARGFGPLIGVEIQKDKVLFTGDYSEMNGDFLSLPKSSNPPVFKALPGAKVLSSLVWRESGFLRDFDRVAPSGTLFVNALGGTVAVMSYHLELKYSYLYSEARQKYLNDVLDGLNGVPLENVCMNAQNVLALSRRAADGADLVLLENLNCDPEDNVLLRRATEPSSIEEMTSDGTWKNVEFTFADGAVCIPCEWPCYGVKVFRLRK